MKWAINTRRKDLIHKDAIQKFHKEFFSSLRIAYSNSHDHAIIQHVFYVEPLIGGVLLDKRIKG